MKVATADAVVRVSPSSGGPAADSGLPPEKGVISGHLSKRWSGKQVRIRHTVLHEMLLNSKLYQSNTETLACWLYSPPGQHNM